MQQSGKIRYRLLFNFQWNTVLAAAAEVNKSHTRLQLGQHHVRKNWLHFAAKMIGSGQRGVHDSLHDWQGCGGEHVRGQHEREVGM